MKHALQIPTMHSPPSAQHAKHEREAASTLDHPHDLVAGIPDRLPLPVIRELSVIRPWYALAATGLEWLAVALAIACYKSAPHPVVYVFIVMFIGARQHALTVIGHDASHFRFLPGRQLNDTLGNILLQWPLFISVEGFRKFHAEHHRHLGNARDGNRYLWKTHTKEGGVTREWAYPKTQLALFLKLLRHTAFVSGLYWIVRGLVGMFIVRAPAMSTALRLLLYAAVAAILTRQGWWLDFVLFWIVPLCTWHMTTQYMRLIAEHSNIASIDPAFGQTRTTIPRWWEAVMILPRNIGYHLEHHWYPSVPFYNLPQLHKRLMQQPRIRAGAQVSHSIAESIAQVTRLNPVAV